MQRKKQTLALKRNNWSEIFSGYCTLYGDMCGALNPLGDLKKMEVYAICRAINKTSEIFSESILTKAPSANSNLTKPIRINCLRIRS